MADLGVLANQIRGLRNRDSDLTAEALEEAQAQLDASTRALAGLNVYSVEDVDALLAIINASIAALAVLVAALPKSSVLTVTLTAPTTAISTGLPTPKEGDILTVFVVQDGTGGRQITWSAEFVSTTTVDISTTPGAQNKFIFVARQNLLWSNVAVPLLGD